MRKFTIGIVAAAAVAFFLLYPKQERDIPSPVANPCTTPSLTITNPPEAARYAAGEPVTITWTSCMIETVYLGLAMGGKDFGHLTQTPIPAQNGSFTWRAANPAATFTDSSTNTYQIVAEGEPGNLLSRSGSFSVSE